MIRNNIRIYKTLARVSPLYVHVLDLQRAPYAAAQEGGTPSQPEYTPRLNGGAQRKGRSTVATEPARNLMTEKILVQ